MISCRGGSAIISHIQTRVIVSTVFVVSTYICWLPYVSFASFVSFWQGQTSCRRSSGEFVPCPPNSLSVFCTSFHVVEVYQHAPNENSYQINMFVLQERGPCTCVTRCASQAVCTLNQNRNPHCFQENGEFSRFSSVLAVRPSPELAQVLTAVLAFGPPGSQAKLAERDAQLRETMTNLEDGRGSTEETCKKALKQCITLQTAG